MGRAKNKENVIPEEESVDSDMKVTLRRSSRAHLSTVQETDEAPTRSSSKRQKDTKGTWKTAQTALFLGNAEESELAGPEDRMKELEDELEFAKEKWETEEENHQKSCVLLTAAEEREKKLADEVRALKEELSSLSSAGGGGGPADARTQKLVNEKRKLAIEVQTLKEAKDAAEQRAKALAAANERLKKGASPTGLTPSESPADAISSSKQLNEQMRELEASLKRKRTEMAEAEHKLTKEQKNSSTLKTQVQELKRSCAEKEKALAACEKELGRIEKELLKCKEANRVLQEQARDPRDDKHALALANKLHEREEELGEAAAGAGREVQELKKAEKQHKKDKEEREEDQHPGRRGPHGQTRHAPGPVQQDQQQLDAGGAAREPRVGVQRRGGRGLGGPPRLERASVSDTSGLGRRGRGREEEEREKEEAAAEREALAAEVGRVRQERDDLEEMNTQQEKMIADLEGRVLASERKRAALHNMVQELRGNIRVFCRVRPVLAHEQERTPSELAFAQGERPSIEVAVQGPSGGRRREVQRHAFEFDQVFELSATQRRIFEEIEPLLQSVMDGYRVCIFAYGQTGSGKTHTMEGKMDGKGGGEEDDERGVIPRCMQRLLAIRDEMQRGDWGIEVTASCVEIYNESIRDLLGDDGKQKHEVLTDKASGETYVSNATSVRVTTAEEIFGVVRGASQRRETASTSRNASSSRSHSVLQLRVQCRHARTGEEKVGVMNMVDLAGSERVGTEHKEKDRLKEAQCINKSLSCLLGVISAIATKAPHVPFRNTKLTHLLSSSLSGNGKALMFANVSPLVEHVHETVNTLRFASQVNSCQLGTGRMPQGKQTYV